MTFHPERFVFLLSYMAKGMLGIFIVMGVIILMTALLNYLGRK